MYLATLQEFKDAVAATVNGKPLIIEFTAAWSAPCKRIGPIYEDHVASYHELTMKRIDIDANP